MIDQIRRGCVAALVALALIVAGRTTLADAPTDLEGAIRIRSVSAAAAPEGGCAEVRLIVDNESRDHVQILGLVSDLAVSSRLLAAVGGLHTAPLDSFSVPPGETVDFVRSRWFELCGLVRPLAPGEAFTAELQTPGWTRALQVHVH